MCNLLQIDNILSLKFWCMPRFLPWAQNSVCANDPEVALALSASYVHFYGLTTMFLALSLQNHTSIARKHNSMARDRPPLQSIHLIQLHALGLQRLPPSKGYFSLLSSSYFVLIASKLCLILRPIYHLHQLSRRANDLSTF